MTSLLPIFFRAGFIMLLTSVLCSCFSNQGISPKVITQDEYDVYSVLIDTDLLQTNSAWFLNGQKLKYFGFEAQEIKQIIILPKTIQPDKDLLSDANTAKIPQDVLTNFLKNNEEHYELENKFQTTSKTRIFAETEEKVLREEAAKKETSYDEYIKSVFPTSTGWMMFSRVGFNLPHDKALVTVSFYIVDPREGYSGGGLTKLVFLTKQENRWIINNFFSRGDNLDVDLEQCNSTTKGYQWGMGSGSSSVGKLTDGKCQISEFHEVEGGYRKIECFIPTNLKEVIIYNFGSQQQYYSQDLSSFCEKPRTGNILVERQEQLNKQGKKPSQ